MLPSCSLSANCSPSKKTCMQIHAHSWMQSSRMCISASSPSATEAQHQQLLELTALCHSQMPCLKALHNNAGRVYHKAGGIAYMDPSLLANICLLTILFAARHLSNWTRQKIKQSRHVPRPSAFADEMTHCDRCRYEQAMIAMDNEIAELLRVSLTTSHRHTICVFPHVDYLLFIFH